MNARVLPLVVAVLVLVLAQFTLVPLLGWRAAVDCLAIAVVVVAVRVRPGAAALTGFVIGMLADALAPEAFGAGALAMTVVAYGASRLKAGFFEDRLLLSTVLLVAVKYAHDVLYVVAERRLHGVALLAQLALWSPLAALVTAVVGAAVLAAVRPTLERRHR